MAVALTNYVFTYVVLSITFVSRSLQFPLRAYIHIGSSVTYIKGARVNVEFANGTALKILKIIRKTKLQEL